MFNRGVLRITASASASGAVKYYNSALSKDDYYTKDQEISGVWAGSLAPKLGLSGEVTKEQFNNLAHNINPLSGESITPHNLKNRRVGYDFTFSAPKSVSISALVTEDSRIIDAFHESVRLTMQEIELSMQTRVRADGANHDRLTGNFVYSRHTHLTTRPVDGIPCPDLHAHCFVQNMTYDEVEGKMKSSQIGDIYSNCTYYEKLFHSHLASNLKELGYEINNKEFGFEIAGIEQETIDKFSLRSKEIQELEEKLEEERGRELTAEEKSELGAYSRSKKDEIQLSTEEIKDDWYSRLEEGEINYTKEAESKGMSAQEALDFAIEHHFQRRSTADEKHVLAEALNRSKGEVGAEEIKEHYQSLKDSGKILGRADDLGNVTITTREVINEELEILDYLDRSQNSENAIKEGFKCPENTPLDLDQQKAVEMILNSQDQAMIIEGGAGTGKTTLARTAVEEMEKSGVHVQTVAPWNDTVDVLKEDGFENSQTVAKFLLKEQEQKNLTGGALWVDEAGLLSAKEINQLCQSADKHDYRLIFAGDTKQHTSVERGDGLRLVKESGKVEIARTNIIHRQQNEDYKQAVELLSEGELEQGFDIIEKMGAVKEIQDESQRINQVADSFIESKNKEEKVLCVSPTHKEGDKIREAIRGKLKEQGKLGEERTFEVHESKNLTNAQKRLPSSYEKGDILRFHKPAKGGYYGGHTLRVTNRTEKEVFGIDQKGNERTVPLDFAGAYDVSKVKKTRIAVGDEVRLCRNYNTDKDVRLSTGSNATITSFTKEGDLILNNKHTVSKDSGVLKSAYVSTSHASQGKTVDKVIISSSRESQRVASSNEFYVSLSRGKKGVEVFTDDKEALKSAVQKDGKRLLATEILGNDNHQTNKDIEHRKRIERINYGSRDKMKEVKRIAKNHIPGNRISPEKKADLNVRLSNIQNRARQLNQSPNELKKNVPSTVRREVQRTPKPKQTTVKPPPPPRPTPPARRR